MLTIFSIPKSFSGHSEIIQRNALQSWLKLEPKPEIFLCGNDPGVAEVAHEFQVRHLPHVETNEYGTPLLSSAFQLVQEKAENPFVCYVNADIILFNDMFDVLKLATFQRFLLVGKRTNLDITELIDFNNTFWEKELRERMVAEGDLQPPFGSDYFIFPKNTAWGFPDFAVGRPGWDNWIIFRARALQMAVVDSTEGMTALHQNHDYAHIPNGVSLMSYDGPEAIKNRNLVRGEDYSFNLRDVTHQINGNSVQKASNFAHLQYRLRRQSVLANSNGLFTKFCLRLLSALLNHRHYFPTWFWQNMIYSLTK